MLDSLLATSRIPCRRADFGRTQKLEAATILEPRLMPRLVLALALGVTGCSTPDEPATGLYQWVDDTGVVHYTTTRELVPERFESSMRLLSSDRGDRDSALAAQRQPPRRVNEATPAVQSPPPAPRPRISETDQRAIAELEAALERDRETLKDLISEGDWDGPELTTNPELRELAERLARQESELAALRRNAER